MKRVGKVPPERGWGAEYTAAELRGISDQALPAADTSVPAANFVLIPMSKDECRGRGCSRDYLAAGIRAASVCSGNGKLETSSVPREDSREAEATTCGVASSRRSSVIDRDGDERSASRGGD